MKNIIAAIVISTISLTSFAVSSLVQAAGTETHAHDTEEHKGGDMAHAEGELPIVTGEVKKVKPKSGKITIRHEEIPNLDMPGMTMVFRVGEETDISQFKKGDKVTFTVIEKDGKMTIVDIESAE